MVFIYRLSGGFTPSYASLGGEEQMAFPRKVWYIDDEEEVTIYSEEGRESLLDEDQLDPFEEAFMRGYDEAG